MSLGKENPIAGFSSPKPSPFLTGGAAPWPAVLSGPPQCPGHRARECKSKCKCKCRPGRVRPAAPLVGGGIAAPGPAPPPRLVGRFGSPRAPRPPAAVLAECPAAVLAAAWSAPRPPVRSRAAPPPSRYHAPPVRPVRNVRSHVAFRHQIPNFLGENGRFRGFWPSIGPVYYGTITGTGPDRPGRKKQWPRECSKHPRGPVRKLVGARVPCPL